MLRPSVSRKEEASLPAWIECVESWVLMHMGTPTKDQQEWIDTFYTIPPAKYDIAINVEGIIRSLEARAA